MIPILFSPAATGFATFGVGVLTEAISPHIIEEINGEYTLELQYPLSGQLFDQIERRSIILAKPNPQDPPQPFRVMRISRPINGIVSIYAEHLSYDLSGVPVLPFTATTAGGALQMLRTNAAVDNPFLFVSDLDTAATLSTTKPLTARSLMGTDPGMILSVYGGEYAYDGYTVALKTRRGRDTDIVIRYGVDLVDVNQEENIAAMYSGVLPYFQKGAALVTGDIQRVADLDFDRILPLDVSAQFSEPPTVEEVNAAGAAYVEESGVGVPEISISMRFAQLPELEALRGSVALGDTVGVEFERLGVDASARIIRTDFDVIREKYISVEVGAPRPSVADTIAALSRDVTNFGSSPALLDAIRTATSLILGATGGSVRLLDNDGDGEPDTLYIADDPDPALAVKVWRFNYEGWGASVNGYDGPFVLGATFQDGGTFFANVLKVLNINADNITTGTINADSINVTNINGQNIKDGTVGSNPLATGAVTNTKLGSLSVSTGKIQNGAVTGGSSGKIAGSTITTSNTVTGINTSLANGDNYAAATVQNASGPAYFNCGTIRARQGQFVDGANGIVFTAKFSSTLGGWYLGSGGEG